MGEELTLEECFSGLEEIIEKMQDTEVSLEDSFALYEQGMKMLKNCNQKIDAVCLAAHQRSLNRLWQP